MTICHLSWEVLSINGEYKPGSTYTLTMPLIHNDTYTLKQDFLRSRVPPPSGYDPRTLSITITPGPTFGRYFAKKSSRGPFLSVVTEHYSDALPPSRRQELQREMKQHVEKKTRTTAQSPPNHRGKGARTQSYGKP